MFHTLYHAGASRRQPMFLAITTAGTYDETSIGWTQHEYARQVADGTIEDLAFFAYIRAADPAADWTDPATWTAANPSIGVTVTLDELGEQCAAAQHSVGLENAFKRYRLNVWTQTTEAWLPLSTFDASAGHPIDEAAYTGRPFVAGIDLGAVSDLSVVAELFPCPHDPLALDLVLRCFLPQAALREGPNALLFQQWAAAGWLTLTSGAVTDEHALVQIVVADAQRCGCESVAIDRLFQAMRVSQDLAAANLSVFGCGMGFLSLSPLVIEMEKLIMLKRLHHGMHPILRAAIDAVEMEVDSAGNRKPTRANRSKKIDAVIATLLALDRQLRHGPAADAESEASHDYARGLPGMRDR
jgi:phage terminase large subunit-like protein